MKIEKGMNFTTATIVGNPNLASSVGSGPVDVFATPMMIALMELAASRCIEEALEPGQVSVGSTVQVTHRSPTPRGIRVTATATVTGVEGSRVDFRLVAYDEGGEIGSGSHSRVIVDEERFLAKADAKRQPREMTHWERG